MLAADLGGTKCRFGLIDEQGGVHCVTRVPSTMDVDVLLSDIKFVGPLSFVETLRDLIPLDGFSDAPYLGAGLSKSVAAVAQLGELLYAAPPE